MGVPLGLLADRFGRRKMIVGCVAFFTSATLLCGLAGTFAQLMTARFATAVGEAGITPSANALISDLYPPERRVGALSLYAASSNIGLVLALLGGGWIAERGGWRVAFFASGAFGLLVFAALSAVLRVPRHDRRAGVGGVRVRTTLAVLWTQPTFRWVVVGTAIASVGGYAAAAFVPSFLARSHHMTPAAIGLALALLSGTFGWAGTALPGLIADRWGHGDVGIGLKIASLALVAALPFQPAFYLAPGLGTALLAAIPPTLAVAAFVGPSFAVVQSLVPSHMRAQAAAILLLVLNLVGLGLGPPMAGLVSELLRPQLGDDALRYALLVVVSGPALPAAFCFWRASRSL